MKKKSGTVVYHYPPPPVEPEIGSAAKLLEYSEKRL